MSTSDAGVRRGARNAFGALVLGVFFLLLAIPGNRDMERLLIGLGVISLLVALAIFGFTAAQMKRGGDSPAP